MSHDLDFEPVPGLPQNLPDGERILWQGRPQWRALARETFKLRWLAAYFAVFVGARVVVSFQGEGGMRPILWSAGLSLACLGLVSLVAYMHSRATVYTITNKRVVMRIGIALPMTWNLPFARIASADLLVRRAGDGDVILTPKAPDKVAWLFFWPHVQPWNISAPRPALRAIGQPERVARLLGEAVAAWSSATHTDVVVAGVKPAATDASPDRVPVVAHVV